MRDVLLALDHVAPGWLTEVLRDQGYWQDGYVMAVHLQKTWPTALSMVAHLESQYTAHALAPLPSQSATSGKAGGLKKVEPLKAVRCWEPLKAVRL
jgi:hypothetical protein